MKNHWHDCLGAAMQAHQFEITSKLDDRHWWFRARRALLTQLIGELLPPSRDTLVVDVGCCTGGNTAALSEMYTCVGIDPSPEAIASARQRFPHGEFICGRAPDALLNLAERADLFLLADVLEHVEDDRALLAQLVFYAKPGSFLLVTAPADLRLWSGHDASHGHYRRYDKPSLSRLWDALPVSVCLLSYFNARLYWPIRAVRAVGRWRGRSYGEGDTDLRMPSRPVNWLLEYVFIGEQRKLLALVRGERKRAYRRGVSLIAILRREENQHDDIEDSNSVQRGRATVERGGMSCAGASS